MPAPLPGGTGAPQVCGQPLVKETVDVRLVGCKVSKGDMERVAEQTQLRTLFVSWADLAPDAAPLLGKMTGIETLHVYDAPDEAIALIKDLKNLRQLYLRECTKMTDAGVGHAAGLIDLVELSVSHSQVGDAGLAKLEGLSKLELLDLSSTRVTDAGLAALGDFKSLRMLYLASTPVTDAGLVHVAKLPRLETLSLAYTEVTDAGLLPLEGLASLRLLILPHTKVTGQGIAKLKAKLPDAVILEKWPER